MFEYKHEYVTLKDKKGFMLMPDELIRKEKPYGRTLSTIFLPKDGDVVQWVVDLLDGKATSYTYEEGGTKYKAEKEAGNLFIKADRDSGFSNIVGFSKDEISKVLKQLQDAAGTSKQNKKGGNE